MVIGIKPMKLTIIDYFVPDTLKRTQPVSLYYNFSFFFKCVLNIRPFVWGTSKLVAFHQKTEIYC